MSLTTSAPASKGRVRNLGVLRIDGDGEVGSGADGGDGGEGALRFLFRCQGNRVGAGRLGADIDDVSALLGERAGEGDCGLGVRAEPSPLKESGVTFTMAIR